MTTIINEINHATITVLELQEELKLACVRTATARNQEIDLLNSLNAAQKKLDDLLANLKKQSPKGSEWYTPQDCYNRF